MKAIQFKETGSPEEVLSLAEIPIPEPDENEVRVKLLASPVNPADLLFIDGKYRIKPSFPQVAGLEGAGIVEKCGHNADIAPGALVSFRHKGAWAEYVVVPAEKVTSLPDDFPVGKACQFSLNPITAFALLEEVNEIGDGEWLLLTAGNSAVSKMIIQMARIRNIDVITVSRNERDFAELKSLGATFALSDDPDRIAESIHQVTNGAGVKFVLDSVGGRLISEVIKSMRQFGKLVSYGLISSENVVYHNSSLVFKNLSFHGFGIDAWLSKQTEENKREIYNRVISILKDPEFQMPVAAEVSFDDFGQALQLVKTVKNGKILLYPGTVLAKK